MIWTVDSVETRNAINLINLFYHPVLFAYHFYPLYIYVNPLFSTRTSKYGNGAALGLDTRGIQIFSQQRFNFHIHGETMKKSRPADVYASNVPSYGIPILSKPSQFNQICHVLPNVDPFLPTTLIFCQIMVIFDG